MRARKTDISRTNMNFVVSGIKLVDKTSRRGKSERIATDDDHSNVNDFSIDCLAEVVKVEELNPMRTFMGIGDCGEFGQILRISACEDDGQRY